MKLLHKVAHVLKESGIYLFIITFVGIYLDQWLTASLEAELMSPKGAGGIVWLWGALSILVNLTYPLLALVFVMASLAGHKPSSFVAKHFSQCLREIMRSWGKTVWWCLLFVIPGLIKFVQYTFVPYVVCMVPEYQTGKLDALKCSQSLASKVVGKLVVTLIILVAIIPLILTVFQEYRIFANHPITAVFGVAVEVVLQIIVASFVFDLFMRSVHESHVSVERS